jgi:hypothetical protein
MHKAKYNQLTNQPTSYSPPKEKEKRGAERCKMIGKKQNAISASLGLHIGKRGKRGIRDWYG